MQSEKANPYPPKSQRFQIPKLKFLLLYPKKHWKKMAFVLSLTIIVSLFALPIPILMNYIINATIPEKDFGLINLILLPVSIQLIKLVIEACKIVLIFYNIF